jgi:hypothetical protein
MTPDVMFIKTVQDLLIKDCNISHLRGQTTIFNSKCSLFYDEDNVRTYTLLGIQYRYGELISDEKESAMLEAITKLNS